MRNWINIVEDMQVEQEVTVLLEGKFGNALMGLGALASAAIATPASAADGDAAPSHRVEAPASAANIDRNGILQSVNMTVNNAISYKVDRAGKDVWKLNPKIGDCEDFAITKRQQLIDAGWNPEDLEVMLVMKPQPGATKIYVGHVFLYVPSADLVLDMPPNGGYGNSTPTAFDAYMKKNGWSLRCKIKDVGEGERRYVSDRC